MRTPSVHIIIFLIIIGCQNELSTSEINNENTLKTSKILSSSALKHFNDIFSDIPFDGVKNKFQSVEVYNPEFNLSMLNSSDTANFSYFILKTDTFDLKVAVNNNLCFASKILSHRGYDYINQFVIHPYDFSWLNKEKLNGSYECINEDPISFREASFDKNMIGLWKVDSTFMNENNNEINYIEFSDSVLKLNKSIKYNYEQSGYYLHIKDSDKFIYKIFFNSDYSIFYSSLRNEPIIYYCSRVK